MKRTTVAYISLLALALGCGDAGTESARWVTGGSGGTPGVGGASGTGGMSGTGGSGGVTGTGGMIGTGGTPGTGGSTGMVCDEDRSGSCVTNALCHTCPTSFPCNPDGGCSLSGYVCVASGCETHDGAPIKQCQPSRGPSCATDADCPNPSDYDCLPVATGPERRVRVTSGCDTATETIDCAPGFSCEAGACVDRRLPCDDYLDCPKSHLCVSTPVSSYCVRTHRTCREDTDCGGFAAAGEFCADVDGDGRRECVGAVETAPDVLEACVNADCAADGLVCESGASAPAVSCGEYGLCFDDTDCAENFVCAALWQDGRKECVQAGGTCNAVTDCVLPHQVCAAPRNGGPPQCQVGKCFKEAM